MDILTMMVVAYVALAVATVVVLGFAVMAIIEVLGGIRKR